MSRVLKIFQKVKKKKPSKRTVIPKTSSYPGGQRLANCPVQRARRYGISFDPTRPSELTIIALRRAERDISLSLARTRVIINGRPVARLATHGPSATLRAPKD